MVRAFRSAGIDLIDVSTGPDRTASEARVMGECGKPLSPTRFAMNSASRPWRFGKHLRAGSRQPRSFASGRADLCAIRAAPHLANPAWTLEAAARQGYRPQWWAQAISVPAKTQLERNLQRAAQPGGPV